jgi:hypothetical protein
MYPFVTSIDIAAWMSAPDFIEDMKALMKDSEAEFNTEDFILMGILLPMLLEDTTATIDGIEWIGADDGDIHKLRIDLYVDASIDLYKVITLFGGGADIPPMDPITLFMEAWVEVDNINGEVNISAPIPSA